MPAGRAARQLRILLSIASRTQAVARTGHLENFGLNERNETKNKLSPKLVKVFQSSNTRREGLSRKSKEIRLSPFSHENFKVHETRIS